MDDPTGTITFSLFSLCDTTCEDPIYTEDIALAGNGIYYSSFYAPAKVGRYFWRVDYTGDGNNNPENGGCHQMSEAFDIFLPGCGLLLGTDNNFILKRQASGDYAIVWCGPPGVPLDEVHDTENGIVAFGTLPIGVESNLNQIATFTNYDPSVVIFSELAGDSWDHQYAANISGYRYNNKEAYGLQGYGDSWNVDRDGTVVIITSEPATPFHIHVIFSANWKGVSFVDGFDLADTLSETVANNVFVMWVDDGWVWTHDWSTGTLYRMNYLGGDLASWVVSDPDFFPGIVGYPGTDRLVLWEINRPALPAYSIDISDPDNPVVSTMAPIPGGRAIWGVAILSNQTILVHAVENALDQGSIWRSTDAGASWVQVQADTSNLYFPLSAGDNDGQTIAINPLKHTELYCAIRVPYVYHSTDSGLTWTEESVDMGIFGTANPPVEWDAIAVACNPKAVFPGLSKFRKADGVQLFFLRT